MDSNNQVDPTLDFVNNLVLSITGLGIDEIPGDQRQTVVTECIDVFREFVIKYIEAKYGAKEATRLKASQQYSDPKIFDKFVGLGDKLKEALDFFVAQRLSSVE